MLVLGFTNRAVAQWFSVPVWGTGGRRFKSAQPEKRAVFGQRPGAALFLPWGGFETSERPTGREAERTGGARKRARRVAARPQEVGERRPNPPSPKFAFLGRPGWSGGGASLPPPSPRKGRCSVTAFLAENSAGQAVGSPRSSREAETGRCLDTPQTNDQARALRRPCPEDLFQSKPFP